MFNLIDKIIGRKIFGSVGEPWNFVSADGENEFLGTVISVESSIEYKELLLCQISKFKFEGCYIDRVIASERAQKGHNICQSLLAGNRVICNFPFKSNGQLIEIGGVRDFLIEHPRPEFLIGSLTFEV